MYGGYQEAVAEFLLDQRTNVNLIVYQEDGSFITALDIATKVFDVTSCRVNIHLLYVLVDVARLRRGGER